MEINRIEFKENIKTILFGNEVIKIIVSNPINNNPKYKKILFENKINHYMVNSYTEKQSFTTNIDIPTIIDQLCDCINHYKQINIFSTEFEFMIKISKSGKIFLSKTKIKNYTKLSVNNNREKNIFLKKTRLYSL